MTYFIKIVIHLGEKEHTTMTTSAQEPSKDQREQSTATRLLLACGVIGPPLFIIVFLIEGATREDYDPLRYAVSSLSIGDQGWIQAANFLLLGILLVAFAVGLRRALKGSRGGLWGPILIGLAGIGLFGAGIFTTDPIFGYPPDAPLVIAQYTLHGHLHDLCSVLFFAGVPIASFVFCRRFATSGERGWALYSLLSGLGTLAFFVLAAIGFDQNPALVHIAGVFQRLSISIGLIWVALLALRIMRSASPEGR
jgi:hypothetical membrane protein